jgi:sterol desaturase/sphingolipid hydroxylase (fatty acid hydroxylase superfamily)
VSPDIVQHLEALAARALALLVDPFIQVLFRGSVFWWPYLLSAAAVAVGGFWLARGGGIATLGAFRRRYLSRRLWAHPSAQADYAYYIVNSILHPVLVAPLVISGAAVAASVEGGLVAAFGPMSAPLLGLGAARVLYTVLFFLAYDYARFLAHGLLHDVPLLWQFHKLHHSAEVLTPLTNYRAHPVELFIMAAVPNLATGLASGALWYLAADTVGFYTLLGAHVFMLPFNAVANLRHFPVWISFGPALNRWLVSPAHHHIHHSADARHFGRNRGFALALWDRLAGTLYVPGAEEELRLGLADGTDGAWHGVGRMYVWPCRYALALVGLGHAPALPKSGTQAQG